MGKNGKSMMGEYFPESVTSAVVPVVKKNKPFTMTEKGKTVYVGMLLDVNEIGGFNKKSTNEKDKGGIIELIKNGNIHAYITKELNDDEKLLFIPTPETMDSLREYGMFRKVSGYEFVKLNDKLEIIEHTGIFEPYDTFRSITAGDVLLSEYVKSSDDVIVAGSDDDPTKTGVQKVMGKAADIFEDIKEKAAPVTSKVAETAGKVVDAAKEKMKEASGLKDMAPPASDISEVLTEAAPKESKPQEQPAQAAPSAPANSNQPAAEVSEEPAEDMVYTETQVMTSIERIFHADNLDLPLSSEPFDQLFTLNNHLIRFDIDSRDTFVNERLNLMATEANRDLQKLRADNLQKLREKYLNVMSMRILSITQRFDISNAQTDYGKHKQHIEDTRQEALSNMTEKVAERKAQLEEDYNQRLEDYCKAASDAARTDFQAKYSHQQAAGLSSIESSVRAEIETEFTRSMNAMYTARRRDALTMLDLNVTSCLQELSEDYKRMFEEEDALYKAKAAEMREYIKELHQLDAKRIASEEERNRITNEVNDARAQASAKIELIKQEYDAAASAQESRYKETIMKVENDAKLAREQMEARTALFNDEKERMQRQLDDAVARADNAHEIVRADYEHRLAQAQDDRDSWKQTLDSYKEQHAHNNRLAAILVIAITIAAIAGGFVAGGVYWNRIVAGELSTGGGNSEIKVITSETAATVNEPAAENAVTEAVDAALTDNQNAETQVLPEEPSGEENAVTTVPAVEEPIASVTEVEHIPD